MKSIGTGEPLEDFWSASLNACCKEEQWHLWIREGELNSF